MAKKQSLPLVYVGFTALSECNVGMLHQARSYIGLSCLDVGMELQCSGHHFRPGCSVHLPSLVSHRLLVIDASDIVRFLDCRQ